MGKDGDRRSQLPGRREEDKWALWDKRIKDVAIFIFGSVGFFHELLIRPEPNIYMIIASGALMNVPLVMAADAKRRGERRDDGET